MTRYFACQKPNIAKKKINLLQIPLYAAHVVMIDPFIYTVRRASIENFYVYFMWTTHKVDQIAVNPDKIRFELNLNVLSLEILL